LVFLIKYAENTKKILIRAVKIALGSCLAILICEWLGLEFAPSAGIIALLSTVDTKLGTVRLSVNRVLSFLVAVALAYLIFGFISSDWFAFGVFLIFLCCISLYMGWGDTMSVNAVAATHLLVTLDFSVSSLFNEFMLILTGVSVAVFFNLFNDYGHQRNRLNSLLQRNDDT
jgi:uncharacterized membrane protein YgaE (UPF0421/DUF939 family)